MTWLGRNRIAIALLVLGIATAVALKQVSDVGGRTTRLERRTVVDLCNADPERCRELIASQVRYSTPAAPPPRVITRRIVVTRRLQPVTVIQRRFITRQGTRGRRGATGPRGLPGAPGRSLVGRPGPPGPIGPTPTPEQIRQVVCSFLPPGLCS